MVANRLKEEPLAAAHRLRLSRPPTPPHSPARPSLLFELEQSRRLPPHPQPTTAVLLSFP